MLNESAKLSGNTYKLGYMIYQCNTQAYVRAKRSSILKFNSTKLKHKLVNDLHYRKSRVFVVFLFYVKWKRGQDPQFSDGISRGEV